MKQLSIQLLGRPVVAVDGQPVRFPTRKSLALFAYVASEGGEHSRQELMALLWPDSSTPAAQASLRSDLARLRKVLGMAGAALVASAETIALDAGIDFTLDLKAMRTALAHIEKHASEPTLPLLHAAVAAYQGEFLQGFNLADAPDFDHWVTQQRQQWQQSLSRILELLAQHALDRRDWPEAIAIARRWVQHAPIDEAAYRSLMQAHFLAGDRGAALQVCQTCQRLLADELGVAPAPETVALAEAIHGSAPSRWPLQAEKAPPAAAGAGYNALPMVGRDEEYASLRTALARQMANPGIEAVSVNGESGVGKTRLATEFLDWAALQGGDVLRGRAYEASGGPPYQAIITALRDRLERENAPEDLIDDVWLAELTRLLPELQERYPDLSEALLPFASDETLARARLFEAVARLIEALSRRRPLVLFLDDWHWADPGSQDLLHYLGHSWAQTKTPILVILTLRSENLSTDSSLTDWLIAWERSLPVTHIWLTRLAEEDVLTFVEVWAGADRDAEQVRTLSRRLFVETAGNPFFLVETVNLLAEQMNSVPGAIDPSAVLSLIASGVTLPPNVRKTVLSRLARQGQTANDLLAAAAVMGRNCRFEEMCLVAGVDELAALPALDGLLQGQLLVDTGDSRTPYAFAHDKTRDVVYTEAGHSRRRIFHQRAVAALEPGAPAAEIAYHAEQGRLIGKARHYLQLAGDAARDLFENSLALDYYSRALALTAAEDAGARYDLLLRLHDAHHLQGNRKEQTSNLEELERVADLLDDAGKRAEVWLRRARYAEVTGDHPAAAVAAQEAVQLAGQADDNGLLAQGYLAWGAAMNRIGAYDQARRRFAQALDCAREAGSAELKAECLRNLGIGAAYQGDLGRARLYFEQALVVLRAQHPAPLGKQQREAAALGNLGVLALMVGDYAGGQDYLAQSQVLFARVGDRRGELLGLSNLGSIAHGQGDLIQAAGYYLRAVALAQEIGDRLSECEALDMLAYLRLDQLQTAAALARFTEALVIARELKLADYIIECSAGLAAVALAEEHLVEAYGLVTGLLDDLRRQSIAQVAQPYRVYLHCYRVLDANHDPRAPALLADAHRLLQEQAGKISDEATRWSFLNNVPSHQAVEAEYAARKNVPGAARTAVPGTF